jgi:hypothetical protein
MANAKKRGNILLAYSIIRDQMHHHLDLYPNIYDAAAFIIVPSMMPRPLLTSSFGLTYRKIPVLSINQDVRYSHQRPILVSTLFHSATKQTRSIVTRPFSSKF